TTMAATARRANHNASPAARTNQASQPRPRRNDNIGTNIPTPNSHPQPRHERTRMPRTATVNTATPTTARGQAFSGGNDVHTATPARVHATTRTTNGEERPTNRRYSLDPSLDLGPDALRTDPPAVGCRRRAVVYWAPGPLPGGRTPPTMRVGAIEPLQLDLAPARSERVLVPPVPASRDTVWRPRTPNVPAVDVGQRSD